MSARALFLAKFTVFKEQSSIKLRLKGQCHEIFDSLFFSLNCTPGSADSWAKTVLHIDSNSRRYSIKLDDKNQLRAMPHSGESRLRAMHITWSHNSALCHIAWSTPRYAT
jgi:hypothetical protein